MLPSTSVYTFRRLKFFTKPDLLAHSERHVWLRVNSIDLIRYCYDAADALAIVYLDGAFAVIGSMVIAVMEELVGFGRSWASAMPTCGEDSAGQFSAGNRRSCSYFGEEEESG